MADLVFEWDRSALKPFMDRRLEKELFGALRKAGSKALTAARTRASTYVRSRKSIRAATIKEALVMERPRGAQHIDDLVWRLKVRDKPIPMFDYAPRQTKKGVTVKVGLKRKLLTHAFLAMMKSGHKGVFWRELDSRPKTLRQRNSTGPQRAKRLKIEELFSTRVIDLFRDRGMVASIHARAQEVFGKTFNHELKRALR